MNIILVSYYFSPANSIATMRIYSFAQHLFEEGHRVMVLAPGWSKDSVVVKHGFDVLYTHKADDGRYTDSGSSIMDYLRRKVLYGVFANNKFRDRNPQAFFRGAKQQIDQLDLEQFDTIITSYGPLDSLWIGNYVKRCVPSIRWIIDYRDYYSLYYEGFGIFRNNFKQFEKKLVSTANCFITVSETLRLNTEKLIQKPGFLIYNSYVPFALSDDVEFESRIRQFGNYLCYPGTLYHGALNIRPFLQFYKKNLSTQFRLVFALTDPIDRRYVDGELSRLGLSEVNVEENLSHNQSLMLVKNAAFPILFSDFNKGANGFLTGKIFEYIYFGKRVVYSGSVINNELYDLIIENGWGEEFNRFDFESSTLIDQQSVVGFSRLEQAKHLKKILTDTK